MQAAANEDQISHKIRAQVNENSNDDDVVIRDDNRVRTDHSNTSVLVDDATSIQRPCIDNRQTIYVLTRLPCGVTVMCHPDILHQPHWWHRIRTILQTDVSYCLQILPGAVRSLVRRTNIWLNLQNYHYCDPQTKQPIYVNHTTTHHHVAWLLW